MKLIIQIPCYNEEATLARTLATLPRKVDGFDAVEWLVIDDGSTDDTAGVARRSGVDHVVRHARNRGLAAAFLTGLNECVARGADVIVNTDADNQYCAEDIPTLVEPILRGDAEFVVGERPVATTEHFSRLKKLLLRIGSRVVRAVSATSVRDAPSGFRAMRRDTAMRLNVFNDYTYTLETIIQAGHKGMAITSVPIRTNPDERPSRLVRSVPSYVRKSLITIVRIFMTYKPFEFFAVPGVVVFAGGFLLGVRFLCFMAIGEGRGHVQSVILAALLLGIGLALVVVGLLADLVSVNRKLLERVDWRLRALEERSRTERAERTEKATGERGVAAHPARSMDLPQVVSVRDPRIGENVRVEELEEDLV